MRLLSGWHPYRYRWVTSLSGPKAAALVIVLCVSLPFLMGGLVAAIFWFLSNVLFSKFFWMALAVVVLYGIFENN